MKPVAGLAVALAPLAAAAAEGKAQLDPSSFQGPEACAKCHPRHYLEWRGSAHAYATQDPIFQACNRRALAETGGRLGTFCLGCHTPLGVRTGEFTENHDPAAASPLSRAGVTCEVCHQMEPPPEGTLLANANFELQAGGVFYGRLHKPVTTPAHETATSEFIGKSAFCGSCHDVFHDGALLEKSFAQWSASPYNRERSVECQDCHMVRYSGQAAVDGPFRETLRRHNFPAVTIPLIPFPNRGYQLEEVQAFLRTAARMAVILPPRVQAGAEFPLTVRVKNSGAGHNLPTGLANERQVWVEVSVLDGEGRSLFGSGHLDRNGDLRDHHSAENGTDPFLVNFSDRFLDAAGKEVPFVFLASRLDERSLRPLEERNAAYRVPVPAALAGSKLRVIVRLLFRPFPPHALRDLGLAHLIPGLPTWEMDRFEAPVVEVVASLPPRTEHTVPGDFPSLQAAIDALGDGARIAVAPGEYQLAAPLDFRGRNLHVRASEGPRKTVLRFTGPAEAREASAVVFRGGEGPGAILEGFTITGGRGTEVDGFRRGGGILIRRASPTLRGNVITGNSARGGVGGGVAVDDGLPTLAGNTIESSLAELGGGLAVRLPAGERLVISSGSIAGNQATRGGGVYLERGTRVTLTRVLLAGNTAGGEGGAIHGAEGAEIALDHATVVHNRSGAGAAAAVGGAGAGVRATNSIFWFNEPRGLAGDLSYSLIEGTSANGSTNRGDFPLFRDPGGDWAALAAGAEGAEGPGDPASARQWLPGDYRLLPGSPAIDAGAPDFPADPDDTRTDLGAFYLEHPLEGFVRGDAGGDGVVGSDDLRLLCAAVAGAADLPCADAADVNDDGRLDALDAASLALFLHAGKPAPAFPFPACGLDPTFGEGLACDRKALPCPATVE